jgi:DNA-binding transcriptional ArsR family regulator
MKTFLETPRFLRNLWGDRLLGRSVLKFLKPVKEKPMKKVPEHYRQQAQVLKALAHPTRLFIVDLLAKGPVCVCDITARVGADVSTVSKHLSVMRAAGIVADHKEGLQVHYHLKTPCVTKFFTCARSVMRADNAARNRTLASAEA